MLAPGLVALNQVFERVKPRDYLGYSWTMVELPGKNFRFCSSSNASNAPFETLSQVAILKLLLKSYTF